MNPLNSTFNSWYKTLSGKLAHPGKLLLALISASLLLTHISSQAQPATEPLLTRAASVRPNLLFILDNSGSMSDPDTEAAHFYKATGTCGTDVIRLQAPINNGLAYDPTKRYDPAYSNTGTVGTNASTGSFSDYDIYIPKAGEDIPALTTKSAKCTGTRYNKTTVNTSKFFLNGVDQGSANPLGAKGPKRTDCATATCTLADEKQNIANWRSFHSNRIKAARTGVGKAFFGQPDTFRIGYATIHAERESSSAAGTGELISTMKDYGLAQTEFYTWLNSFVQVSGTPLRLALDVAGKYYSRTDNAGPWAHSPWKVNSESEASSAHLSCRRSYTVLVTDGEWNGASAQTTISSNDIDNTVGGTVTHADGVTKYRYEPRSSDPRNIGKADKTVAGTAFKDTLADVAMYYWVNDLRTLSNDVTPGKPTDKPFWQNMITYTAGFGVQGTMTTAQIDGAKKGLNNWIDPATSIEAKIDDLIHAAHNGGGEYLQINDAESFAAQIGRVVGSIAGEQFSQAGVAASAVTLTAGTKKFVPYYTANLWWGNVKMINLAGNGDETGVAWETIETDNLGKPTGNAKISSPATRKVYTWNPTAKGYLFNYTNLLAQGAIASSPANNTPTLLNNTTSDNLVKFWVGDRSNEGDSSLYRKREAILGDIVNSTPVYVKDIIDFKYQNLPSSTPGYSAYAAYKATKAARTEGLLFIGANDGMVHAFREGSSVSAGGTETFAYVPRTVYGNMHELANKVYQHKFFVDGPLTETDAYITANNQSSAGTSVRWANLVLGSLGAGGRGVFALDTTTHLSMSEKSVHWDINYTSAGMANLGYIFTDIQTGITASGDWVAIFGNGPYGASGRAHLFVVNLSTGAVIKEINTNTDTGNGLGGVRLVRNASGMIIGAYAGDLKGNVWRFDLSAATSASWPASGARLFTALDNAGVARPITATPGVIPRTDKPGYMVVVGTGKLYDNTDQSNVQTQAAYGLWDTLPFGSTATFSAISTTTLVPVATVLQTTSVTTATGGTNPDGITKYYEANASRVIDWNSTDRGWVIPYTLTPGQRTIFAVEPLQKVVRIDTIAPRLAQFSCTASTSQGFNFLIDPLTGGCRALTTLDTNGDGEIDNKDATACVYSTEADGEDVVLDIRNASDISSGFVDIQDSRGHLKARVGDPICTGACCLTPTALCCITPSHPSCIPGGPVTRSWRQLFMR